MKKNLFLALFALLTVTFTSCSSDDENKDLAPQEKDVQVYITYTLDTSNGGDMNISESKATSSDVFNLFYAKIKTGEFVAPTYDLTFTETTSGAKYNFAGKWTDKDMITLKTGVYTVTGTSSDPNDNVQDKASLIFNEKITINATTTSVKLNPQYDSFLLIFAKSNITSLMNDNGNNYPSTKKLFTFDNYYYTFVKDNLYGYLNSEAPKRAYLQGTRDNGSSFKIYTGSLKFEKGKYYIYNDVSNSFNIPPMVDGNSL